MLNHLGFLIFNAPLLLSFELILLFCFKKKGTLAVANQYFVSVILWIIFWKWGVNVSRC